MTGPEKPFLPPHERRRRRRRGPLRRVLPPLVLAAVLFAAGVAVGEALNDNPSPGGSRTDVRTLRPLSLAPARQTVTVTVTRR